MAVSAGSQTTTSQRDGVSRRVHRTSSARSCGRKRRWSQGSRAMTWERVQGTHPKCPNRAALGRSECRSVHSDRLAGARATERSASESDLHLLHTGANVSFSRRKEILGLAAGVTAFSLTLAACGSSDQVSETASVSETAV